MSLYSVSDAAEKLGVKPHRVTYVARTRGINVVKVGGRRVFDDDTLALVRQGLRDVDSNRREPQTA